MVDKHLHCASKTPARYAISLALVPFCLSLLCVVCFDAFDNFGPVQILVPIWCLHLQYGIRTKIIITLSYMAKCACVFWNRVMFPKLAEQKKGLVGHIVEGSDMQSVASSSRYGGLTGCFPRRALCQWNCMVQGPTYPFEVLVPVNGSSCFSATVGPVGSVGPRCCPRNGTSCGENGRVTACLMSRLSLHQTLDGG